jgi:hypothetical protein
MVTKPLRRLQPVSESGNSGDLPLLTSRCSENRRRPRCAGRPNCYGLRSIFHGKLSQICIGRNVGPATTLLRALAALVIPGSLSRGFDWSEPWESVKSRVEACFVLPGFWAVSCTYPEPTPESPAKTREASANDPRPRQTWLSAADRRPTRHRPSNGLAMAAASCLGGADRLLRDKARKPILPTALSFVGANANTKVRMAAWVTPNAMIVAEIASVADVTQPETWTSYCSN